MLCLFSSVSPSPPRRCLIHPLRLSCSGLRPYTQRIRWLLVAHTMAFSQALCLSLESAFQTCRCRPWCLVQPQTRPHDPIPHPSSRNVNTQHRARPRLDQHLPLGSFFPGPDGSSLKGRHSGLLFPRRWAHPSTSCPTMSSDAGFEPPVCGSSTISPCKPTNWYGKCCEVTKVSRTKTPEQGGHSPFWTAS